MIDRDALDLLIARTQPLSSFRADDGTQVVALPDGFTAHNIAPQERPLLRIVQTPMLFDEASFIDYVNRFKSEESRIFAVPGHLSPDKQARVTAALDYHGPSKPQRCQHVVSFAPRYSEQWVRWTKAPPMPQAAFAEFIEENRIDIIDPDAAVLLDMVSKFRATRKQDYDSVVYQPNGDIVVAWSDKTESAGKPGVSVPDGLKLGIPVFFRDIPVKVPCFMRYRLSDGKLTFAVKVDRPEYIEQDAFDLITKRIGEQTAITPYLGIR